MAAGYVLDVEPEQIDRGPIRTRRSDATLADGDTNPRRSDGTAPPRARAVARSGYAEFAAEPWAWPRAPASRSARLDAVEAWAATAIGAEHTTGVAGELEAVDDSPSVYASRCGRSACSALATEGRSAEAMRGACTNLRSVLGEELGVDPSGKFLAIETAIVRNDPIPAFPELGGFGLSDRPAPTHASSRRRRTRTATGVPPLPRLRRRPRRTCPPESPAPTPSSGAAPNDDDSTMRSTAASSGLPQVVADHGRGRNRQVAVAARVHAARDRSRRPGAPRRVPGRRRRAVPRRRDRSSRTCAPSDEVIRSVRQPRVSARGPTQRPDAGDARLRLFLAASRMLLDAARDRATVLIVEDIHWSDDATLGLVRHLVAVAGDEAAGDDAPACS